MFLPGESQGRRSLAGCSPWGREEPDTTERRPQLDKRAVPPWPETGVTFESTSPVIQDDPSTCGIRVVASAMNQGPQAHARSKRRCARVQLGMQSGRRELCPTPRSLCRKKLPHAQVLQARETGISGVLETQPHIPSEDISRQKWIFRPWLLGNPVPHS